MRFPIDILWIKNGKVVDLEKNIQPPRPGAADETLAIYLPDVKTEAALEVGAGFVNRHNISIGDEVKILSQRKIGEEKNAQIIPDYRPLGYEYFIETLRQKPATGRNFRIGKLLSQTRDYKKFKIFYQSGELTISGIMNVPNKEAPPDGFPVLILNHGLIHPKIYFSGRGSRREQDFFVRHGYITIHPDYRGHAESSPNPEKRHDFYVGYSEDVINLIDALKKLKSKSLDVKRIGMWGHSMGGGMATRVMVLNKDVRAYVLFAPISAEVQDNFYELAKEEVKWLEDRYGKGLDALGFYQKISPLSYFAEVESPVQIHHGTRDKDVPLEFSQKIFETLRNYDKRVEFFQYPGEGHEFGDGWSLAAERTLQFFDKYVKPR